jgi:hypothetical protein
MKDEVKRDKLKGKRQKQKGKRGGSGRQRVWNTKVAKGAEAGREGELLRPSPCRLLD